MLIAGVKRSNRGNSVRKTDEGIVRRICDKLVPYEVLPDFMVLNKNDRKNARNPLSRRLPRHFAPFLSTANSIFWGAFSNQWRCHQKNVNKLYCSVQSQLEKVHSGLFLIGQKNTNGQLTFRKLFYITTPYTVKFESYYYCYNVCMLYNNPF